ncbi:response regulator transcription factor [Picosynechococcus sp. PCC 8807]|uniref:response regulator transcription factor n=1 Tax=Picosynechococcus sp. PCC 8807 TaxID=195248 RepID=UPI0008104142|nr:response regulator transcription factor [Picosynechococcus sp. PCC 8807]ANV92141.1 DNA-binding response regulator [Picosynechococcus sp. PCC 8807]
MTSPLKVLLIEDDELFRLGLATRLQQEALLEITAEAEDGETALDLITKQEFDIIILDVGLPGIGGVETCRQIKQQQPQLPILVLTSHSQPTLINRLIEAQAQGYCLKGVDAESLILAIQSVAAGASWWDAQATQQIRAQFQQPMAEMPRSVPAQDNPLTQREGEILALIANGKSNSEIAETLYIASGTVRVHVHAILQKLEARDRTQAVVIALRHGLIKTDNLSKNPAIDS